MARRKILVADLLCGAGGSSTGCERALRDLGLEMELVCVNHWQTAIDTHTLNHPGARHYVQDIATVRPHLLVPEGCEGCGVEEGDPALDALLQRVSEAVRLTDGLTVTLEARDAECILLLAESALEGRP